MPSHSLIRWNNERAEALDEIENAHVMVGGTERGRRYATQQINYAYAALLSSHFQGFCRDLHTESVDHIVGIVPLAVQGVFSIEMHWNRGLDRGNPNPSALGADFKRLGIDLWPAVYALSLSNERRRAILQEMIDWRNAIVHQDFDPVAPAGVHTLHLATVRSWRRAVNALARYLDQAMYNYLNGLAGAEPW